MTYDPNSNKAKQGLIAEQFIADYYKQRGCIVEMYPLATDKNPASVVDMKITTRREAFFVEVKVKRAVFMWGKIFPVYSLETWKRERYQKIQADYGIPVGIFFVDVDKKQARFACLDKLLERNRYQNRMFPELGFQQKNGVINDYFHIEQFPRVLPVPDEIIDKISGCYDKDEIEPKDDPDCTEVVNGGTSDCYEPDDFQSDKPTDEPTDTEIEQPMPTQGELPPSTTQKSLNELIQQLADAIKCPAEEVRVAAKALIIKHNPIVNDLFGGSS